MLLLGVPFMLVPDITFVTGLNVLGASGNFSSSPVGSGSVDGIVLSISPLEDVGGNLNSCFSRLGDFRGECREEAMSDLKELLRFER